MALSSLQRGLAFDPQLAQTSLPRSNKSNSPFRYAGGKFYARRLILDVVPYHEGYCEPFAGGASVFFAKPKSEVSILNDLDEEVINTLICIRDDVEELILLLDGVPAQKELHHYYKDFYTPTSNLERAFRWFYLNRTSYSGIMRQENCYWGFGDKFSMRPENWPPHLRTVSDKLQGVTLKSEDFEAVIDSLPDGYFIFVDPPYYDADQHKLYTCTFDAPDHQRLAECLRRNSRRLSFLLTYDDHPGVKALYEWADTLTPQRWNYTINRTDDQRNGKKREDGHKQSRSKGRELFIRNYHA